MNENKIGLGFLFATAVICGAVIMMIEVLGSRVVGPFFGVSLFVWTSLITVTLIALAAGYAVGGMVADRYPQPRYLYYLVLAAGVLVLVIPVLKAPVLKACVPLGLRGGSFASALILFGPSLFLLGCVSPYLVKIAAKELHNIGRLVGGLYALSTVGSTIGTVLTGFFLIVYLGVDMIFAVIGSVLILLTICYFLLFEKRWWAASLILLPLLLFYSPDNKVLFATDGTRIEIVHRQASYYGELKVVDYSYGDRHTRELMIDGQIQGGIDMKNWLSIYDYTYFHQFIPHMLLPDGENCLIIGLGLGIVLRWYEHQGIACDVVDIDPAIIEINKNYFDMKLSGTVVVQDARYFLANSTKKYDYIIMDVFNGDITPGHLLSIEAMTLLKNRLSDRGVLSINLIGSVLNEVYMTASVIKTMKQVFKQVDIYPAFDLKPAAGIGNLAIIAYQGKPRMLSPNEHTKITIHPKIKARISAKLGERFSFTPGTPAIILTDDYNPIDFYDGRLRETIRNRVIQTTNWDLMIS